MNITAEDLRQIIKEETQAVLFENTGKASPLQNKAAYDAVGGSPDRKYLNNPEYMKAYNDMKDYIDQDQPLEFDDSPVEIAEKKKKPCKPAKGKRFAKRVDGKCRSYGQAGKAKGGGDRIRPGTKKGDAYCARSLKIKKCKNPPCANDLSRKKWKCRGAKSMR